MAVSEKRRNFAAKLVRNISKYINPFLDWSFKFIFGRESVKDLLIGFLNALFAGRHVIVDVEFKNVERQHDSKEIRAIIYDVFCTTDKGELIIIEMQNRSQKFFRDRALYYMSRAIAEQGEKNQWNYELSAVYGVFFLNFRLEDLQNNNPENSLSEVALVETESGAIFNPKFRQYFIELPRFNKTEKECVTDYDKWIYNLKNMDTMETMPFTEDRNSVFARLEQIAARANLSKEEREIYEEQWRNYNDYYNTIDYAAEQGEKKGFEQGREEGRIEGRKEGREEGREEERLTIARAMKSLGCDIPIIRASTGLSKEEIEKL